MGCVSSILLSHDDEFAQLGSAALGHHIVSLTSSTYGLLTLDPPQSTTTTPPTPHSRFTLGSIFSSPESETKSLWSDPRPEPEVTNSWELMAGLNTADSFRLPPLHSPPPKYKENLPTPPSPPPVTDTIPTALDRFELICPPNGENRLVLYTTTLRGVRSTFEACTAVRAAIEILGLVFSERDISMDSGFREELRQLLRGKKPSEILPPQVFIRGRYIGGVEEVMGIVEEGKLVDLLHGLPRKKAVGVCEGCGGVRFLPCFDCNGSCKMVRGVDEEEDGDVGFKHGGGVIRCTKCNENGLVMCPICC